MSTLDNLYEQLNAQLDGKKTSTTRWKPTAGDRLVGEVRRIAYVNSANGIYGALTIVTPQGQAYDVAAYHTTLKRKLVEKRVQVGDLVGIRFDGSLEKSTGGGSYFAYDLAHIPQGDRDPSAAFDPDRADVAPDLGFLSDVEPQR